ncbi:MAG: MFS transporter [Bacteroidota bacterium]|nr:MFS transporter [Bacteroidota bacterium]MDX5431560.1 MFS transporter [Bacteroidota bacterium]MDX5470281.1 MFS transporter [Bacteroidota bacterium]
MKSRFSRPIWILSLVSLFTDIASEMLYPVMPIYLESIGFSIVIIGVLEGVAESISGLSKGYFGKWSDEMGKRIPFIRAGYSLSGISRPMLALWANPIWVFLARTADRFGKGLRTGARDAMLSDLSEGHNRGAVFGFHRGMDTLGAVIGPGLALLFLHYLPGEYRTLFYWSVIPGIIAVALTFLLNEKVKAVKPRMHTNLFAAFHYWKNSSIEYKKLSSGLLLFALFNSSDVFLLLKLKEAGWNDTAVIGVFMLYNLFYAAAAYPMGKLADRFSLKSVYLVGLIMFSLVYFGMAINHQNILFLILFALYGLYSAATQGISKAWISGIASENETATAIGTLAGFESIATFLASTIAGILWFQFGAGISLALSGFVALLVAVYLYRALPK